MTAIKRTLKRATKLAVSFVWHAALLVADALGLYDRRRLTILYYHSVRADQREAFRAQVRMAKAWGAPTRADHVGKNDSTPRVAITFDDAFMSVIENALPILAEEQFPCAIFVPAGCLGAPPGWAMESNHQDRGEIIAGAETLRAISSDLVTIGAHSVTHPRMTTLSDDAALAELVDAREQLRRILDHDVDIFAFPYGDFNARLVRLCEEAGYLFAFSIGPGTVDIADAHTLRHRVPADPDDSPVVFWLKLRGGFDWMRVASKAKRQARRLMTATRSALAPAT